MWCNSKEVKRWCSLGTTGPTSDRLEALRPANHRPRGKRRRRRSGQLPVVRTIVITSHSRQVRTYSTYFGVAVEIWLCCRSQNLQYLRGNSVAIVAVCLSGRAPSACLCACQEGPRCFVTDSARVKSRRNSRDLLPVATHSRCPSHSVASVTLGRSPLKQGSGKPVCVSTFSECLAGSSARLVSPM